MRCKVYYQCCHVCDTAWHGVLMKHVSLHVTLCVCVCVCVCVCRGVATNLEKKGGGQRNDQICGHAHCK